MAAERSTDATKTFKIFSGGREVGLLTVAAELITVVLEKDDTPQRGVNAYGWSDQRFLEIAKEKLAALGCANPVLEEIK